MITTDNDRVDYDFLHARHRQCNENEHKRNHRLSVWVCEKDEIKTVTNLNPRIDLIDVECGVVSLSFTRSVIKRSVLDFPFYI